MDAGLWLQWDELLAVGRSRRVQARKWIGKRSVEQVQVACRGPGPARRPFIDLDEKSLLSN